MILLKYGEPLEHTFDGFRELVMSLPLLAWRFEKVTPSSTGALIGSLRNDGNPNDFYVGAPTGFERPSAHFDFSFSPEQRRYRDAWLIVSSREGSALAPFNGEQCDELLQRLSRCCAGWKSEEFLSSVPRRIRQVFAPSLVDRARNLARIVLGKSAR